MASDRIAEALIWRISGYLEKPAPRSRLSKALSDDEWRVILAALRADPAPVAPVRGDGGCVTLTKAEHRKLLIAAGEFPSGMFVKVADQREGLHPSEVHVRVDGTDGSTFLFVDRRSLINGHLSVGHPICHGNGKLLIELPREADDGRWRIWVPASAVVSDPDPAPDSQQTEGQGDAPREKGAEP